MSFMEKSSRKNNNKKKTYENVEKSLEEANAANNQTKIEIYGKEEAKKQANVRVTDSNIFPGLKDSRMLQS